MVINAHPMKFAMLHHINTCINALLRHTEQKALTSNQDIRAQFEQQEATILRPAQNTEECLQLSKDIAAAEAALEQLQAALKRNAAVATFLEDFRCGLLPLAIMASCAVCVTAGCVQPRGNLLCTADHAPIVQVYVFAALGSHAWNKVSPSLSWAFAKATVYVLQVRRWHVPQVHVEAAYEALVWPRRMAESIEAATRKANREHTQLQRQLKTSSAALQADLDDFSRQVAQFATLSDMKEQTEYAGQGAQLMANLEVRLIGLLEACEETCAMQRQPDHHSFSSWRHIARS